MREPTDMIEAKKPPVLSILAPTVRRYPLGPGPYLKEDQPRKKLKPYTRTVKVPITRPIVAPTVPPMIRPICSFSAMLGWCAMLTSDRDCVVEESQEARKTSIFGVPILLNHGDGSSHDGEGWARSPIRWERVAFWAPRKGLDFYKFEN